MVKYKFEKGNNLSKKYGFKIGNIPWNKGKKMPQSYYDKMKEVYKRENFGMRGKHHSEESKQKSRESHLGKKQSIETRLKQSLFQKGRHHSKEHNLKVSLALKGRQFSEETKQKMSLAKIGKKASEETKRKLSLARIGNKNTLGHHLSEEHKRKLSENSGRGFLGKHHSLETIKKISEYKKGKHFSPKTEFKKGHKTWITGNNHSIETRKKLSASKQGIPLNEWKKFISREPYDQRFENNFKREIRKRDNQVCMLCGIHREKLNRALYVHHINYDKQLTIPENCLSLCLSCHIKTNANRKHWTNFFQSLLSEKYNYTYSEKNIIINLDKEMELK